MATATVTVSGGASLATQWARTAVVSIGPGVAIGRVNWNSSTESRASNNWLPRADHGIGSCPSCKTRIRLDPLWFSFFKEIAENRLGGVQGATIPAVQTTVQQTQAVVVDTTATLTETIAYARSIDATATALTQVAIDNGQAGATTVPETSDPPQPPGTQLV